MSLLVTFFIGQEFWEISRSSKIAIQIIEVSYSYFIYNFFLNKKNYKIKLEKRGLAERIGLAIWNRPGYMKLKKTSKKVEKRQKRVDIRKTLKKGRKRVEKSKKRQKRSKSLLVKHQMLSDVGIFRGVRVKRADFRADLTKKFLICQISPTRSILSVKNRPSH